MSKDLSRDLERIYSRRFDWLTEYRLKVWHRLCDNFFQKYVPEDGTVLDLGCGYGQFINRIKAKTKYGMDLNPSAEQYLDKSVTFLQQDCSLTWNVPPESLDVVFTSNFFEHLLTRDQLHDCIKHARAALKPSGRIIAMGPNIRVLHGQYWDFIDHSLALTDVSMNELLELHDFTVDECHKKFLPYRMTLTQPPLWTVDVYLKFRLAWHLFGKQFLIIGRKPA